MQTDQDRVKILLSQGVIMAEETCLTALAILRKASGEDNYLPITPEEQQTLLDFAAHLYYASRSVRNSRPKNDALLQKSVECSGTKWK